MSQGTGTPKVTAVVGSGNLKRQIGIKDNIAGIVGTSINNIGVIQRVFGYEDAVAKGYTEEEEPFLNAQVKLFYNELGGNQELWIYGVEDTMTLTQMVTATNANGIKKMLLKSKGRANLIYVCRQPSNLYEAGEDFLDQDVPAAVLAAKALCLYQRSVNRPIRILIEGRVANEDVVNDYTPNTASNTFVGVTLSSPTDDGSGCGALALARVCLYGAHNKIGNGLNGALSISEAFIGSKPIEDFYPEELDVFANAGFIIMHIRDGYEGFYFARDNMAGDDDFHILAHGLVIDKAQRISVATVTPNLESDLFLNGDGTITDKDALFIQEQVKAQLLSGMSGQISGADCIMPTDVDLVNTSTGELEVKVLPKGYLTWLIVKIGLTSSL